MKSSTILLAVAAIILLGAPPTRAQKAPDAGYIFPPGGKAGTTVNVQLGGYDWTPDMELFVHDKRVMLEVLGPAGTFSEDALHASLEGAGIEAHPAPTVYDAIRAVHEGEVNRALVPFDPPPLSA